MNESVEQNLATYKALHKRYPYAIPHTDIEKCIVNDYK